MELQQKELYETPTTELVEVTMETGILNASANVPEDRQNVGDWGIGEWY